MTNCSHHPCFKGFPGFLQTDKVWKASRLLLISLRTALHNSYKFACFTHERVKQLFFCRATSMLFPFPLCQDEPKIQSSSSLRHWAVGSDSSTSSGRCNQHFFLVGGQFGLRRADSFRHGSATGSGKKPSPGPIRFEMVKTVGPPARIHRPCFG